MTEETDHRLQLLHGELAQRARQFARQHEDPPLYNHGVRSYTFSHARNGHS